ncbi:DUF1559 domain-containing protein [Alienimonas chondri]|uniref:DUF1559 domain-containing protein n=1 Tax=Alienimonas chondri TaxID=2681879 RepID=A0ABX1VAI6_9PLAN|nr:DUF1559 domain-containing protein [Alienimonas chondri]NNJ25107.1 hypothetical protein [Alienimonas chondri]
MSAQAPSPPSRDPSEGALRRAGIAAALALLVVAGLWATRPAAQAQPPRELQVETAFPTTDLIVENVAGPPIELGGVPADDRTPADLLPAGGAAAFVTVAGTDVLGPALEGTAAHEALVESGLFPAVGESFSQVWEEALEQAQDAFNQATGAPMFIEETEPVEIEMQFEEINEGAVEEFDEDAVQEIEVEEFDQEAFDEFQQPAEFEELQVLEEDLDAFDAETMEEEIPTERAEALAALQALGDAVKNGGVALSIHLPEGPPFPALCVVLPGAADEVEAVLSQTTQEERDMLQLRQVEMNGVTVTAGNIPGAPPFYNFGLWRVGEHLVAAAGPGAVEAASAVSAGDGEALSTLPLAESTPDDALVAGWLDFAAVADRFGEFPAYEADWRDEGQVTVNEVLTSLGLDALAGFRGSLSVDGKALRSDAEWTLRGAPRGLLAALDPSPITMDDLPPMPAEVGAFAAGSVDFDRIYDGVVEALAELAKLQRPESQERALMENPSTMLNDLAWFDVRASLLEPLGNVAAVYSDPADGGLFGLGGVVAVSVDDAAALRAGLQRFNDRILRELPPGASEGGSINVIRQAGAEITTISIGGFFRPSVVVTDDWVVFAPTPQAVAAFLYRVDGTLPRWEPTGRWAPQFERVPDEFTSLAASDPRPAAAFLNNLIGTLLPPINEFADGPTDIALPPTELVTGPLFPNVSWAVNTGEGVRGTGYASLPVPAFAGGGGAGSSMLALPMVAGGIGLLLPAVQAAREAARRTQSANNIKQMGLAAHNYYDTFKTLPRGTVEGTDLPVKQRLSFMVALLPFMEQQALAEALDPKQAWNAGPNGRVARSVIPSLVNPSIPSGPTTDEGYAVTHYVGIAGVGAKAATAPARTVKTGVFGYDRATKFRDITDGLSNTLMYGSVHENVGPWAQGGPSTIRAFTQKPYINGPDGFGGHPGGTQFGFADGSVQFISENVDPSVLEALSTTSGAEPVGAGDY